MLVKSPDRADVMLRRAPCARKRTTWFLVSLWYMLDTFPDQAPWSRQFVSTSAVDVAVPGFPIVLCEYWDASGNGERAWSVYLIRVVLLGRYQIKLNLLAPRIPCGLPKDVSVTISIKVAVM